MRKFLVCVTLGASLIGGAAHACLASFIEESSPQGLTKICYYEHLGERIAITRQSYQRCDATIHVTHN